MDIRLFALIAVLGLALALIGVRRTSTGGAAVSVLLFAGLLASTAVALIEHTGRPRPVAWEWRAIELAQVVAALPREPDTLYFWLRGDPPIAYSVTWTDERARETAQAQGEAGDDGIIVFEKAAGGWSPPSVRSVKPPPQPAKEYPR